MEIHRLTREILEELEKLDENEKYYEVLEYYHNNTSNYYFPNDLIAFYPYTKQYAAKADTICDFTECILGRGNGIC